MHTIHCFNSFYPEYFADNQILLIIGIFRRFHILSFTRSSLHYKFSKFAIKYSYNNSNSKSKNNSENNNNSNNDKSNNINSNNKKLIYFLNLWDIQKS